MKKVLLTLLLVCMVLPVVVHADSPVDVAGDFVYVPSIVREWWVDDTQFMVHPLLDAPEVHLGDLHLLFKIQRLCLSLALLFKLDACLERGDLTLRHTDPRLRPRFEIATPLKVRLRTERRCVRVLEIAPDFALRPTRHEHMEPVAFDFRENPRNDGLVEELLGGNPARQYKEDKPVCGHRY